MFHGALACGCATCFVPLLFVALLGMLLLFFCSADLLVWRSGRLVVAFLVWLTGGLKTGFLQS